MQASSRPNNRSTLRRLLRNRSAVVGGLIVHFFLLAALFGPMVLPHDPFRINPANRLQGPSAEHWMGTDEVGRDVTSRVVLGGRYSMLVGLASTLFGAVVGLLLGIVAGYVGGITSQVIMRGVDVLVAFPGILLAIAIVAALGPGLQNLVVALGLATVPMFARLAFGLTLGTIENDYVTAARSLGNRSVAIMWRHILPNITPTLIIQFTLRVATVILLAASLGYLGLGVRPPSPEWGALLANSRDYMRTAFHLSVFPGLAIAVLVLGLNLMGDGLRDVLDPKLRGGGR